jgi:hypothetical protein
MNRFWRGVAIFVLGGVLGTGFGVALKPERRVASRAVKGRLQFLLALRCILQKQHEQDARLLRRQVIGHHRAGVHQGLAAALKAIVAATQKTQSARARHGVLLGT